MLLFILFNLDNEFVVENYWFSPIDEELKESAHPLIKPGVCNYCWKMLKEEVDVDKK